MSNTTEWYAQLPVAIRTVLLNSQAWVVGSGAKWILGEKKERPRDIDILVPPPYWLESARILGSWDRKSVLLNTFGGFKIELDGKTFDIWPAHLEDYFSITPKTKEHVAFRWQPRCVVREGEA